MLQVKSWLNNKYSLCLQRKGIKLVTLCCLFSLTESALPNKRNEWRSEQKYFCNKIRGRQSSMQAGDFAETVRNTPSTDNNAILFVSMKFIYKKLTLIKFRIIFLNSVSVIKTRPGSRLGIVTVVKGILAIIRLLVSLCTRLMQYCVLLLIET